MVTTLPRHRRTRAGIGLALIASFALAACSGSGDRAGDQTSAAPAKDGIGAFGAAPTEAMAPTHDHESLLGRNLLA